MKAPEWMNFSLRFANRLMRGGMAVVYFTSIIGLGTLLDDGNPAAFQSLGGWSGVALFTAFCTLLHGLGDTVRWARDQRLVVVFCPCDHEAAWHRLGRCRVPWCLCRRARRDVLHALGVNS